MATVTTSHETKRGCGYRQAGGTYLMSFGEMVPCGRLPVPLEVCPTCSGGIKHARGWTWIDADKILEGKSCDLLTSEYNRDNSMGGAEAAKAHCDRCSLRPGNELGRCGLIWIGKAHYETPAEWMEEASKMGVSRRIPAIPRGFKLRETRVFVAHIEATWKSCPDCTVEVDGIAESKSAFTDGNAHKCKTCKGKRVVGAAAIFNSFVPTRIDYIVSGEETEEELDVLEEKGFTLIKVVEVPDGSEAPALFTGEGEEGSPMD